MTAATNLLKNRFVTTLAVQFLSACLIVGRVAPGITFANTCAALGALHILILCETQVVLYFLIFWAFWCFFKFTCFWMPRKHHKTFLPLVVSAFLFGTVSIVRLCSMWSIGIELQETTNTAFLLLLFRSTSFFFAFADSNVQYESIDTSKFIHASSPLSSDVAIGGSEVCLKGDAQRSLKPLSDTDSVFDNSTTDGSSNGSSSPMGTCSPSAMAFGSSPDAKLSNKEPSVLQTRSETAAVGGCPYDFGLLHYIHYMLYFPGIFCGPWLSPKVVHNACTNPRICDPHYGPRPLRFAAQRLLEVSFHIMTTLGTTVFGYTDQQVWNEEFLAFRGVSALGRIGRCILFMEWKHGRLAACWGLSEIVCAFAGVGFTEYEEKLHNRDSSTIPVEGEKSQESAVSRGMEKVPTAQTVARTDDGRRPPQPPLSALSLASRLDHEVIIGVRTAPYELAESMGVATRNWNVPTHRWLLLHVYKRLPRSAGSFVRRGLVFAVSALWHGTSLKLYTSGLLFLCCQLTIDPIMTSTTLFNHLHPRFASVLKICMTQLVICFVLIPFCAPSFHFSWLMFKASFGFGAPFILCFCGACHLWRFTMLPYDRKGSTGKTSPVSSPPAAEFMSKPSSASQDFYSTARNRRRAN